MKYKTSWSKGNVAIFTSATKSFYSIIFLLYSWYRFIGFLNFSRFLILKIAGIDDDSRVVKAAQKNGKNFGKDIKILKGDIFKLIEYFEKDSFDVCISRGLLEHFKKEDIKKTSEAST